MKIAIQGHSTRGKEVIQILESLGGINRHSLSGTCLMSFYYINKNNNIKDAFRKSLCNYKYYTLEEFEKEFPFKIGDKVITTDGTIGIIVKLEPGEDHPYCIKADVGGFYWCVTSILKPYKKMKEERNITLTLDKAKEWYQKGGELKEVALQAYSEKELNLFPRSWEEFCENYPIQDHEAFINYANSNITICKECVGSGLGVWKRKPEKDRCKCVSQKSAEAHLAMMQLEHLRDCWRQGWKPDWLDGSMAKYVIKGWRDKSSIERTYVTHAFLSFPTYELALEFQECFRDLIEKAGDLI